MPEMKKYEELFEVFKINMNVFIDKKIAEGQSKFVIIPMGEWGKYCRDLLRERGIDPLLCLDNYNYNMADIFPVSSIIEKKEILKDAEVLIAVHYEEIYNKLVMQLSSYDVFQCIEEKIVAQIEGMSKDEKIFLNFLCVGSSLLVLDKLYNLLNCNSQIGLPKLKETRYLEKILSVLEEEFIRCYPKEVQEKALIGGIESRYMYYPNRVKSYFGENIKVIFCVKNPINALYDYFIESMRTCSEIEYVDLYKKYNTPSIDMFYEFSKNHREMFNYSKYLRKWFSILKREQILVVFEEDLLSKEKELLKEIQLFIGLSEEQIVEMNFVQDTSSKRSVAKDYMSAQIQNLFSNNYQKNMFRQKQEDGEVFGRLCNEMEELTTICYDEKIPEEVYYELLEYYKPCFMEMESILERNLEGLWY